MIESLSEQDSVFMARAVFLAKQGLFTTQPNPRVGCVLVSNNQVIGEGWHVRAGQGHAEVEALKHAANAQGATAYVTLEPCNHQGRTPPCAEALIKAGVVRVVVAMQDPNPLVAGKGITLLEQAGIEVVCGVLEEDARALNTGFITRMLTEKPYVTSKLAMSLDGRTAMVSGESKWITSAQARYDVQTLRAASSAVLTGVDTVLADDPSLNVRMEGIDVEQPVRVILDSSLRTPVTAKLLSLPGRTLILTVSKDEQKIAALTQAGAQVHRLAKNRRGRLELEGLLRFLVAALVVPGDRIRLTDFYKRVFAHYGIALGGDQLVTALNWCGHEQNKGSYAISSNTTWVEEALQQGGFLVELSDAVSMIKNPG